MGLDAPAGVGVSPLVRAAEDGDLELLRVLLLYGANVFKPDRRVRLSAYLVFVLLLLLFFLLCAETGWLVLRLGLVRALCSAYAGADSA
jgi:hypothetical protein